jgi:tetratricopeptide (TPR) repeat protein
LGGIFAWTTVCLTIASAAAAVLALRDARSAKEAADDAEPLALVLGILVCVTAIQATPLPQFIAHLLAPDAVEHAAAARALLGLPAPHATAFTLDPARTYERVLYGATICAIFCAARLESRQRRGSVHVAVALSGLMIALSHLVHVLLDAKRVYGLYLPLYTEARGPLLNPNNLAGFLALTTPVCLGLAMHRSAKRAWWLAAAVMTAATCVFADSRGGTAALVGGVALYGVAFWWSASQRARSLARMAPASHTGGSSRKWIAVAVGFSAAAITLGMAFALARIAAQHPLDATYEDLSKLDLMREEATFLSRSGVRMWMGFGRGAFPAVFSAARFGTGRAIYAENFALQYAIEFGVPTAALFLGATLLRVSTAMVACRSPLELGGLCGCIAIATQNLADFSLELTGIAIPAAACLAASLPSTTGRLQFANIKAITRGSVAIAVVALLSFGLSAVVNDSRVVQRELERQLYIRSSKNAFWKLYRSAALSHPADPGIAALGAARKSVEGSKQAWPWFERALLLAPDWGSTHLWAANWLLVQRKQDSALDQLKLALERDPTQGLRTLCDWLSRAPYAEVVFRVAPSEGARRWYVLDGSAACLPLHDKESAKVDAVLLAEQPTQFAANLRTLQRRLKVEDALEVARDAHALRLLHPRNVAAYQVEAEALLAAKQPARAVAALSEGLGRVSDQASLLTELAVAQAHSHDETAMRDTIEQLRMASSGDVRRLAQASITLSRAEAELGNHARALKAARDSYDLLPTARALGVAAVEAQILGQTDYALQTIEQACQMDRSFCPSRDAMVAAARASRSFSHEP